MLIIESNIIKALKDFPSLLPIINVNSLGGLLGGTILKPKFRSFLTYYFLWLVKLKMFIHFSMCTPRQATINRQGFF